ncbi:MAG: T9SS type A sorting domain-containing protein, partial [Bacteroidia bacterium]
FTLGLFLIINVAANAQTCFNPIKVFKPVGRQTDNASVISADFNRDGKIDLATTNEFINAAGTSVINNVSILLGTGTGNFTAVPDTFVVGDGASQLISADFNRDGEVDLATVNYSTPGPGSVSVLLGTGTGSFSPAINFLSGFQPSSIASADFNHDGFADIVTANPSSEKVWVSLGNGTGNFNTAHSFTVGGIACSVISADFNNDGKTDLATANGDSNSVSILLGTGTGSFGPASTFSAGVTSWWRDTAIANANGGTAQLLITEDFNGDGKLDLAVAHNDSNIVSILLGSGTGSFGAVTNFAVNPVGSGSPNQIISADFNGDGKVDLAAANPIDFIMPTLYRLNNTISVLLGNGTGGFGTATSFTVGNGPNWVASSDFNGDGKTDLAVVDTAISVLLNCAVLGIESIINGNELHIYPNPSTGIIHFELESSNNAMQNINYGLQITNILGETILQTTIQQNTNATIDLSTQSNGVYFIMIQAEGKQYTQKVIKD